MRMVFFLVAALVALSARAEDYIGSDGPTFTIEVEGASQPHPLGLVVPKDMAQHVQATDLPPMREPLPAKFSWKDKATPIKDQGSVCGSCWAFSASATMADVIALHGKGMIDFSEQYLVSCVKESDGCDGGWYSDAFVVIKKDGHVLEKDFPYKAQDLRCPASLPHVYKIAGLKQLPFAVASPATIKQIVYTYGPVSVGLSAVGAFGRYKSGIYNEGSWGQINHAVNIVGWDETVKPAHWIIRNSWGERWGEKGFGRIAYGSRKIGYAPAYIDFAGPVPHAEVTPVNPSPAPVPAPTPVPTPGPCEPCTFWRFLMHVLNV